MSARRVRLVRLEDGDDGEVFALRALRSDGGECVIGRGDDCAVVIDDPRVSRHHVSIRRVGDQFGVADLGTANGTMLGDYRLGSDPVALQDGNVIVLAGAIALRFEVRESRLPDFDPRLAASLAAAVLALALVGGLLIRGCGSSDPLILEARATALQAREAALAGRHSEAVDGFREAAGRLFTAGRLDDVPRGDVVRIALERVAPPDVDGASGADLWALFQKSLEQRGGEIAATGRTSASPRVGSEASDAMRRPSHDELRDDLSVADIENGLRPKPPPRRERDDARDSHTARDVATRSADPHPLDVRLEDFGDGWIGGRASGSSPGASHTSDGLCHLDRVPPRQLHDCVRAAIDQLMIDLRQATGNVPEDFAGKVGRQMWREHSLLTSAFRRRELVEPMMRKALVEARLPQKLHYLALIESGYRRDAESPAGATGLWQFMKGTGLQYGLRIDGRVDERRDPLRSSEAAARYLRDLTFEFGGDAILLALASYNRGENAVRRSLKKLEDPFSDRSYWRLVERGLLPDETALYVTRFAAAAVAGEYGLPRKDALGEAFAER